MYIANYKTYNLKLGYMGTQGTAAYFGFSTTRVKVHKVMCIVKIEK